MLIHVAVHMHMRMCRNEYGHSCRLVHRHVYRHVYRHLHTPLVILPHKSWHVPSSVAAGTIHMSIHTSIMYTLVRMYVHMFIHTTLDQGRYIRESPAPLPQQLRTSVCVNECETCVQTCEWICE